MADHCAKCRKVVPIELLDAKPTTRLRVVRSWLLPIICGAFGQRAMLRYAADHGIDFDRVECQTCYGPEYCSL